jgi:hypothetical protein
MYLLYKNNVVEKRRRFSTIVCNGMTLQTNKQKKVDRSIRNQHATNKQPTRNQHATNKQPTRDQQATNTQPHATNTQPIT